MSSSSVSTIDKKILTYHRIIETFRFADVQKLKLGDPHDENITEVSLTLLIDYLGIFFTYLRKL